MTNVEHGDVRFVSPHGESAALVEPPRADNRRPVDRSDLLIGLVISLFVHLIGVGFLGPRFATNDDPTMLGIASGAAYGEPSENLVFINVIFGYVLKGLYTLIPGIPWYGLLLYGIQGVALAVLIGCCLPRQRSPQALLALGALLAVVGLNLATNLHFTAVGVVAGGAGIILTLRLGTDRFARTRLVPIAAGLLGAAFLIRADALLAACSLMAPIAALHVVRRKSIARPARAVVVLSLALIGCGIIAGEIRYRGEDWSAFRSFDEARGQLHGTPRIRIDDDLQPVLDEAGWSWSDRSMFDNFFFTNKEVFTQQSLETILRERGDVVQPIGILTAVTSSYEGFRTIWLLVAAAAFVVVSLRSRWLTAVALLWPCWLLLIMSMLQIRLRLPSHVAVPLLFTCGLGVLGLPVILPQRATAEAYSASALHLRRVTTIAVAILCWVAMSGALPGVLDAEKRQQLRSEDGSSLAAAQDLAGPNGAVIVLLAQVGFEAVHPVRPTEKSIVPTIILGWNSRTPDFDRFLEHEGLDDLDQAILSRQDLAIVATEREAAVYSGFVFEHLQTAGALWPIGSLKDSTVGIYSGLSTGTISADTLTIRRGSIVDEYVITEPAVGLLSAPEVRPRTTGFIRGWIGDPAGSPSDYVLVFIDGQLAAATTESLTLEGAPPERSFFSDLPSPRLDPDAEVRVFGIWGHEARELISEQ